MSFKPCRHCGEPPRVSYWRGHLPVLRHRCKPLRAVIEMTNSRFWLPIKWNEAFGDSPGAKPHQSWWERLLSKLEAAP